MVSRGKIYFFENIKKCFLNLSNVSQIFHMLGILHIVCLPKCPGWVCAGMQNGSVTFWSSATGIFVLVSKSFINNSLITSMKSFHNKKSSFKMWHIEN